MIPTAAQGRQLISDAGGRVLRIEGPHEPPNPHDFPHINYLTSRGLRGTLEIAGLEMMGSALENAWKTAALDLGIHVTSPVRLTVGDEVADFDVLIAEFGSRAGTVVSLLGQVTPVMGETARKAGVFVSELSPDAYLQYDRSLFIETLRDWGWFGAQVETPVWLEPWI